MANPGIERQLGADFLQKLIHTTASYAPERGPEATHLVRSRSGLAKKLKAMEMRQIGNTFEN